ncbi:hypothetical protein SLEP1_g49007 [Rubroshorea leprosula]|uniref:cellulase n=1 Tax=Rubroshorea leprosula TaxID=152421 RepID=A0AAV5LVD6_9ROSI|nr:hypothetical protein SLEP1_g49007 [Rubroshorea leprosula]
MGREGADETKSFKGWFLRALVFVLVAFVVAVAVYTILTYFHLRKQASDHNHSHAILNKYTDALEISLQFFDNGIGWRGDSGLLDGEDANLDLSNGMFDAGDLIKFGFPMAFTATVLSWAILEYGDRMNAVKQLGYAQESLTWITNFLINAHPSANVLYIQVANA